MKKEHLIPIHVELAVFGHANLICGCIDCVCLNTETQQLSIYDWKRNKGYVSTSSIKAQLNLYRHIFELCGRKISRLFVCNLYRNNAGLEIEDIAIDEELVTTLINPQTSEQQFRQASEKLGRKSLALV